MKRKHTRKFRKNVLNENGEISEESKQELMQRLDEAEEDYNPALKAAESKIFAGVWIQFLGTALEAQGSTEAYFIELEGNDPEDFRAERQALFGVYLQLTGNFLAAIGISQELSPIRAVQIKGAKLGIIGAWFESFGAAIEALGETDQLLEDLIDEEDEDLIPLVIP
ncbi:hypothetical protein [Bacillus sp. FJAT-45037]|uniref:hypothetical protein n=1 Tax=Bacillus sp. FJAT-45037 TaxID=2011007 RepID=UPI000C248C2D|nr:hypothetical protein [Bacillus sp. FJAT-45037]